MMEKLRWKKDRNILARIVGAEKMTYDCRIINVDEDEVTVQIGDTTITGFANCGVDAEIGEEVKVEILLYDDIEIELSEDNKMCFERLGKSFKYSIWGVLDIENAVLKSLIDFEIDQEELYNYGHLDGKYVRMDLLRLDLIFE